MGHPPCHRGPWAGGGRSGRASIGDPDRSLRVQNLYTKPKQRTPKHPKPHNVSVHYGTSDITLALQTDHLPARGQPGRVGQERVIQHQVGVSPTHIAPVRSGVPLSCKGLLRVLTQPVPVVNIANRHRSALDRRLDSRYPEELENPAVQSRGIVAWLTFCDCCRGPPWHLPVPRKNLSVPP